ncbi:MAG: cohesin domain-containing protein [Pyrinomonadaceae bacterium]
MSRIKPFRSIVTPHAAILAAVLILSLAQHSEAQSAFTYQVAAKTGDLGINQIWPEVSVNSGGKVAFLATVPRTDGVPGFTDHIFVYNYDGTMLTRDISPGITGAFENRFMPGVLINNDDRVLVRRRLEDPSPLGTIVSTYLDGWYANSINTFDRWIIGVPLAGEFAGIFPFPSLSNNNNGLLFKVIDQSGVNRLAISTTQGAFTIGLSGDVNLRRPMLADNNTLILRTASAPFTLNLLNFNYSFNRIIAGPANGFNGSSVGMNSSISDDGKIVVFYADVLPASFPDTVGLNPGVGIFAAVNDAGTWKYKRLAGLRNNGYLDPGETFVDLNGNGQFDPATEIDDGDISGFFPDEKIGVSISGAVVYKATNSSGQVTLRTNQVTLSNLNLPATAPIPVVTQGETLGTQLNSPIQDVSLYDPINQSSSGGDDFAFWVSLQNASQAVVKAIPCQFISVEFESIDSPVTNNPGFPGFPEIPIPVPGGGNLGLGKRIFPDKPTFNDNRNFKRLRVKAQTSCAGIAKDIYFKSFDVDDPSSNTTPLDKNGAELGGDNRDVSNPRGTFFAIANPNACGSPSPNCARTDANGVATVEFEVGMSPGDNYKIGAAFAQGDLDGILESSGVLNSGLLDMLDGRVKLTEKLYVWRQLHIEVDSMGIIPSAGIGTNHVDGIVVSTGLGPRGRSQPIRVLRPPPFKGLEYNRFEDGTVIINGVAYKVRRNTSDLLFLTTNQRITVPLGTPFTLFDDDDLCGNGNGDEGCDIGTPDLSLVQPNDDPSQNVYTHAYIVPEYASLIQFASGDVPVNLNMDGFEAFSQIDLERESCSTERDDYWVAYVQGAYQGATGADWDADGEPVSSTGGSPNPVGDSDNEPNIARQGGLGSLIYLETVRDKTRVVGQGGHSHPGGVVAHEIGHQFGLSGDNCLDRRVDPSCQTPGGVDYGIMSYGSTSVFFDTTHLSKLRSRVHSPGLSAPSAQCPVPISEPLKKKRGETSLLKTVPFTQIDQTSRVLSPLFSPGDLDLTFDSDGKATSELNTGKDDFAYAVKMQSDGKIIVVGDTDNGTNTDFGIVRYGTDGSLDATFGSGGKATFSFGTGFDFVNAVAVQSDGKIILAGYTETTDGNTDFALMRLQSNGTLDTTFGTNGNVVTDIASNDQVFSLALESNGKIMITGFIDVGGQADLAIARYDTNGTLDTTFDTDGIVITAVTSGNDMATDIALQTDGKIVIAGETENGANTDFFVARYESNGALDNTFGTNGRTIADFATSEDGATSLVIQPNGKIVVGGYTGNLLNPDFALARFNSDGSLDPSFGSGGKTVTDFVGNADFINDIALRGDGMIIAVGHSYNSTDSDLAVARYLADGSLDATFGTGGKVMTPIGASDDFGIATAIQPDNKIVVAGASFNGSNYDFAVARYLSDAATVSGSVTYGNAIPAGTRFVSNVLMSGAGSVPVSVVTGAGATAGQYSLTGFGAGGYTVTPSKTGGVNGSISSFDAAKVAQHVAGVATLTGNQLTVADVTGNGKIQSFDAALIGQYAVNTTQSSLAGTWKFIPDSRNYASVTSNVGGEDYSALLMGEVSGNWNNTGARPGGKVNSEQWTVNSEDGGAAEKPITVTAQHLATSAEKEIVVPVNIDGVADKGIISYEFDLRYDPTVIQPLENPVDVTGTVSRGLSVVTNTEEPGLLRVVVYGAFPIDSDGVLLNLRFTAVGAGGSVSALAFERMMFNEGETFVTVTDGLVKISGANE